MVAFAERVGTVGLRDAAEALRITQPALRKRLPVISPAPGRSGPRGGSPWPSSRKRGAADPPDAPTQADLWEHPRVDVIIAVSDEFGPGWLLNELSGNGGLPTLSSFANPIAAGSYVVAMITFTELIRTIVPLTNLAGIVRSAQSLGPAVLRKALTGAEFDLAPTTETPPELASTAQLNWEQQQVPLRHGERVAHLRWFLRVLTAVAGTDPDSIEAVAQLILSATASRTANPPDMAPTRVIDRRRRHPVQSVNLNRAAGPAVARSRVTIKADAAEQLFAVDTSTLTLGRHRQRDRRQPPGILEREGSGAPVTTPARAEGNAGSYGRSTWSVRVRSCRRTQPSNGLVDWSRAIPYVERQPPMPMPGPPPDTRNRPWIQPTNPHGTHVAGILAADWPENGLRGICPGTSPVRRPRAGRRWDGRRVLDRRGAPAHPPHERTGWSSRRGRREREPLGPARRRELLVRLDAGVRGVRSADPVGRGGGGRGGQRRLRRAAPRRSASATTP